MSCASKFTIPNPNYQRIGAIGTNKANYERIQVPCRWCLNCRVDKRNFLEDCLTDYFKVMNGYGAFTTLTYDVAHAPYVRNKKGELSASLRYDHWDNFIHSLRRYVRTKLPDSNGTSHNFKELCVGEYGEEGELFDRPHMHVIFLGLDYKVLEKILPTVWKHGYTRNLPIKDGAFRYVLKYCDKQQHGDLLEELFDQNNRERPFAVHSTGLATHLIESQFDFIVENHGSYKGIKNVVRPIPQYYKDKFLILSDENDQFNQYARLMEKCKVPKMSEGKPLSSINYRGYSLQQINDFKHSQAIARWTSLVKAMEDSLTPVDRSLQFNNSNHGATPEYLWKLAEDSLDPIPF